MPSPERPSTKHSSSSVVVSVLCLLWLAAGAASAATSPAEKFTRGLDAYFTERPYRAIALVRESMSGSQAAALREPSLYVLGQCFAQIRLYEKSEDSFNALLLEFPGGQFAPLALREMARIFFMLGEYAAVVNLEQSYRGRISERTFPSELWYLLGQSNYLLGRVEQARDPLLRVPPGNPFHPFALYTLAQVEFTRNRPQQALGVLQEVSGSSYAPSLLKERALRMMGMILYQEGRFLESIDAYRSIPPSSPLFGVSRVDVALSAEALGTPETAREAFSEAMEKASDDLIRTEAKVAVGRFLNRQGKSAAARTLFETALQEIGAREARTRENLETDGRFRQTFRELVDFGKQGGQTARRQRLAEDHDLLRSFLLGSFGRGYERPSVPTPKQLSPETYLFPLLQSHFHDPAIIETFINLSIEIEDLSEQISQLESEIRGQSGAWDGATALAEGSVPESAAELLEQTVWLLFAQFDLVSRFYDSLALEEKIDEAASRREKQRALAQTFDGLRLVRFGERQLPSRESLLAMMETAKQKIESGTITGMMSQKVRTGFLQEWRSDRDSVTYVLENLALKERQILGALSGVPLRSRNLNLPVLTTMTDWLQALQKLSTKYRYIEIDRDQRPWFMAGKSSSLTSLLGALSQDLRSLNERGVVVIREAARRLADKEHLRHSLISAQADEGIADALYRERSGR